MISRRLLIYPRFRSQIVLNPLDPASVFFKELPLQSIDLSYHVSEVGVGERWTAGDTDAFISLLHAEDMDPSKPPFRLFVINDMIDGRSVLLASIDHTIGDGAMLMDVLLGALDGDSTPGRAPAATALLL